MTQAPLTARYERLLELLRECGSVCVGLSGGVDSVLLTYAAVAALGRERVLAVTGISPALPEVQRQMARRCASLIGVPHVELETQEMEDANYTANPPNRCYFCKSELWTRLRGAALEHGMAVVLDGSNADDVADHRPGMRAGAELAVRAPLLEAGLTKADVRALSQQFGLPTWDEPAAPCLASRLPYGIAVTTERLAQVESAERALRALGFRELRVRHHGDVARLELAPEGFEAVARQRTEIFAALKRIGFGRVLLDVEGYRRGALNEGLVQLGSAPA